jgi:DNA-directed RNA polymerase subunit RPC12/RpoP
MDLSDSLKDNQTSCINCGALLDLDPQEIESGEYTCPECGEKNKISNPKAEKKEVKALLENDSYADCVYCGTTKELSQNEIIAKSFRCNECRMENELVIETRFTSRIYNENMVQCENCKVELELEPEEILAKYFLCSECGAINRIEEEVNYAVFHIDTKESKCIKCDRKLILEQDEIDRKYFFCPKCDTENFLK